MAKILSLCTKTEMISKNKLKLHKMRKILLTAILYLVTFSMALAQSDCIFCGTWIGSWTQQVLNKNTDEFEPNRIKKYIRIDKYGDEYKIRIKYENTDRGFTSYEEDNCSILYIDNNLIRFKLTDKLLPDYGGNDIITGYSYTERFYELSYKNGYVHLRRYAQFIYEYDRYKHFIRKWDGQAIAKPDFGDDIDMYNENDNW